MYFQDSYLVYQNKPFTMRISELMNIRRVQGGAETTFCFEFIIDVFIKDAEGTLP